MKVRNFLLIFLVIAATGSAKAFTHKPVDLGSLNPEIRAAVLQRFPGIETEKQNRRQLDELIRFLNTQPQFKQVQILDEGGSSFKIRYFKFRRIKDVSFEGLDTMSESEARTYFPVKAGDPFDSEQIIEDGKNLRQAYNSMGFKDAVIDFDFPDENLNSDEITIVVKVRENKRTRINSIGFTSPNQKLNDLLARSLNSWRKEPLTEKSLAEIQKKIREILNKNHYVRADISGPQVQYKSDESLADLNYRVFRTESYSISYEGNKDITTYRIDQILDLENFYSANPNIGPELAAKIRNYYQSRGYARAEVTYQESDGRQPFEKKLLLTIDEGPLVKLQKIVVNGKYSRPAGYYENFLRRNSSPLIKSGYYNKDDLDTGYKNLVLSLQNQGYLLAKITSTRSQYNRAKDHVTVVVNLEEGPLTEIQSVEFTGNHVYDNPQLLEVSQLHSSGPLKLNEIDTAIANLKNFYRENGYIEMMLLNENEDLVTYDATNTRAKLNFKIFEGPQVRVASIALEGNTFTKDYVIMKELELHVGDIVTPAKLEESIARLQRTGFFATVDVKTVEEKTETANRTLLVRVTERDPGVFTIGVGATSERTLTLRGYLGISYRNLAGTGRGVSARVEGNYNIAQIKYLESKVTLGYLEPYLFNTRVRGRVSLSRSKQVTDYGLHQVTETNQVTYSLEKDFTSHVLGIYNVWGMATIVQDGYDDTYPSALKRRLNIATTGPVMELDYRDNPFIPTTGTFTRLVAEYSAPWLGSTAERGPIEYFRGTASFTHYLKLSQGPWVWANNVQGGYLENLSGASNGGIPYDIKGFILGGETTVRGFEAGTSDVFPNKTDLGSDQYWLTTSATMALVKSELRFPIHGNFAGAVFYDGGYVKIQDLSLGDNYRDSAGVGLRYVTPVGPVNMEWAWKLDRKPGEATNRFHLSIGTF